jgi:hypothetical protein
MLRTFVLAVAACAALPAVAQPIDFSSNAGREQTCRRYLAMDAKRLTRDEDRAAWSICGFVELVRDTASWARTRQMVDRASQQQNDAVPAIRAKLEEVLARIDELGRPLEAIRGGKALFTVRPGEWVIDWDGDGKVTPFERYLLWVPRREVANFIDESRFSAAEAYYEKQFLSPTIKVDQADVHWALAYLHFGRAAAHLVLSYDIQLGSEPRITLKDAGRVRTRAYRHLLEGVRHSSVLRAALLKETDDEDEWIPNPKQQRTSFPLLMDPQTFTTWGLLLGHLEKLFRGQTLLGGTVQQQPGGPQTVRDLTMGICKPGEGINVRDLFQNPLPELFSRNRLGLAERCVRPTAAVPFSGLAAMVAESVRRNAGAPGGFSGEAMILRHFMWVN